MGLTEKTLEINITHELLTLGHGIWHVLWRAAYASATPSSLVGPPIYASGLSLKEEKKHGWDVSIDLPATHSRAARIAFLQFKLGQARKYSTYPGTLFPSSGGASSRHALFGINNNSSLDQHGKLRATAVATGVPDSALYAFPTFTSEAEVKKALGSLIGGTCFFSVPDIDVATSHAPIVNGISRKIAVSKSNILNREVRSKPTPFDTQDRGGELLAEITAVKMHDAISTLFRSIDGPPKLRAARGLAMARSIGTFVSYFMDADIDTAVDAFGPYISRTTGAVARFRRPSATDDDLSPIEKMKRDRIRTIALRILPLLDALASDAPIRSLPEIGELRYLVPVPLNGLRIRVRTDGFSDKSLRLNYIII